MNSPHTLFWAAPFLIALQAGAQGTFTYDQQSSTDETPPPFGAGSLLQNALPTGQSFTPSLPGVDFIRLLFDDGDITDGLGATAYLNLRSDAFNGPVLATSATVEMQNGFQGTANFFFVGRPALVPGTTYYFEIVLPSAGPWRSIAFSYNYPRGEAFAQGLPLGGSDYWFREGIIVPEPSSAAILILGALLFSVRRKPNN